MVEEPKEQMAIECLRKYKLASSEGVNKLNNRMIRFEILKKILLEVDDITVDVLRKVEKKLTDIKSDFEIITSK